MKTITYEGILNKNRWANDDYDALYVGDTNLLDQIVDDMEEHGHFLTVRFSIGDKPHTLEDSQLHVMAMLDGLEQDGNEPFDARHSPGWGPDHAVQYYQAYSEITGYLWTEANLMVGGHDLQKMFREHMGKYLVLEVTYSEEPREE